MVESGKQETPDEAIRNAQKKGCLRLLAFYALCLVGFLVIWQFLAPERPTSVAFSDFMILVRADPNRDPHVQEVSVQGRTITFWVNNPEKHTLTKRVTVGPERMEGVLAELEAEHIAIGYEVDVEQTLANWGFAAGVTSFLMLIFVVYALLKIRVRVDALTVRLAQAEAAAKKPDEEPPAPPA